MQNPGPVFNNVDQLLSRLTNVDDAVFVAGAPLTAPVKPSALGVPDVNRMIELVREIFHLPAEQKAFLEAVEVGENRYQAAFDYLLGARGMNAVNDVIVRAVLKARTTRTKPNAAHTLNAREQLDQDGLWHFSPGVNALGELVAHNPTIFGKAIITSNFDTLIEAAIRSYGGQTWQTNLDSNEGFSHIRASGCNVVHIHGNWSATDTLHTHAQIACDRPSLEQSLFDLLAGKTIVVLAYGGWDDIFTRTLKRILESKKTKTDVLWTFFSDKPTMSPFLLSVLSSGVSGRVVLYKKVDCHDFLPKLAENYRLRRIGAVVELNKAKLDEIRSFPGPFIKKRFKVCIDGIGQSFYDTGESSKILQNMVGVSPNHLRFQVRSGETYVPSIFAEDDIASIIASNGLDYGINHAKKLHKRSFVLEFRGAHGRGGNRLIWKLVDISPRPISTRGRAG